MINLPTKILLAIKPMQTQFKFTLRLICTPEYKYTPEYIYTRVFFAHANWTLVNKILRMNHSIAQVGHLVLQCDTIGTSTKFVLLFGIDANFAK